MSAAAWISALIVTFLAAVVQGVVGVGFAMVSVPILALIDPSLAPVPQLLITLPMTLSMAWRERLHMELSGIGWIIGGRIPGAVIGVALLAVATQRLLEVTIAVAVLLAVTIIASGVHIRRTPATEFGAGLLSGTSGLVASIGGPPLALLYSKDEGPKVRSNLAAIFSIGLSITIAARVSTGHISGTDLRVALVLFPALALGYVASLRLKDRMPQALLRKAILVLSSIGALGLIVRALV